MKNVSFFLLMLLLLVGFTTTSNMGLKIPSPGDTDYPTSISDSFSSIDQHDHTSGKGVQIPSAGIADGAISTAKLASNSVTQAKLAAKTVQISGNCGLVNYSSTTTADIANLSVNITTTGRPVVVGLMARDGTNASFISMQYGGSSFGQPFAEAPMYGAIFFDLDGTNIAKYMLSQTATSANAGQERGWPSSSFVYVDTSAAAGNHTYKARWALDAAGTPSAVLVCTSVRLFAYEL